MACYSLAEEMEDKQDSCGGKKTAQGKKITKKYWRFIYLKVYCLFFKGDLKIFTK